MQRSTASRTLGRRSTNPRASTASSAPMTQNSQYRSNPPLMAITTWVGQGSSIPSKRVKKLGRTKRKMPRVMTTVRHRRMMG